VSGGVLLVAIASVAVPAGMFTVGDSSAMVAKLSGSAAAGGAGRLSVFGSETAVAAAATGTAGARTGGSGVASGTSGLTSAGAGGTVGHSPDGGFVDSTGGEKGVDVGPRGGWFSTGTPPQAGDRMCHDDRSGKLSGEVVSFPNHPGRDSAA
jgi:hypothetical protein